MKNNKILNQSKEAFKDGLFKTCQNELLHNERDLFNFYNLIISNLDNHLDLLEDIFRNDISHIRYIMDDYGYTEGEFEIILHNNITYKITLKEDETYLNIEEDYSSNEVEISLRYLITKIIVTSNDYITDEDVDKAMLETITNETNMKIAEFKTKQKLDKLSKLIKEKNDIENKINGLKTELKMA